MKLIHKIQLIYFLVRGVISYQNVSYSLKAGEVLRKSGLLAESLDRLKQASNKSCLFKEENTDQIFNLNSEINKSLHEGSLGFLYFKYLDKNNLNPNDLTVVNSSDEASQLENRVRKTHDLFHLVLGFDTSIAGELGIQAFLLRQFAWPFALVAIGGACFVTIFKYPNDISENFKSVIVGWQMGATAKQLIIVNWEDYWALSLNEVRERLSILPPSKLHA